VPRIPSVGKCAAIIAAIAVIPIGIGAGSYVRSIRGEVQCINHAKIIGLACLTYAQDHGGNFPPSFDALFPTYLDNSSRSILVSPLMPSEPVGYTYTPGLKTTSPNQLILVEDKFSPKRIHKRIVLHVDGSVEDLPVP